jgi:hypothetical protein
MAEDELSAFSASSHSISQALYKLFFSAFKKRKEK